MLKDISLYKDTKRNEKCPCDSGKIFKQCCMKEYRQMKKQGNGAGAKISSYSPLQPLSDDEKKTFTEFYTNLMIFTNQYRHKSEIVTIEDKRENIQQFIQKERVYFHEDHRAIIEKYLLEKKPTEDEKEILNSLQSAIFDDFFLVSKSKDTAVILSKENKLYNVKALNSPFDEIFNMKQKYLMIKTALIPYKDGYITDGIFNVGMIPKELEEYLDKLPYQDPNIIYNKEEDMTNIEFALTFSIGCDIENFKTMEEILLKNIQKNFAKAIKEQINNEYAHSLNVISSMIRTTDFLELLEDSKAGHQTLSLIFGGLPVMNFEKGNSDGIVPYELFANYYNQVNIEQSVSFNAYKKAKDTSESLFAPSRLFSSFYTMLGVININRSNYEKLGEFVATFKNKNKREPIANGIENLCEELGDIHNFEIHPVFIDATINLNKISEHLGDYYEFMKKQSLSSLKVGQRYSRKRG